MNKFNAKARGILGDRQQNNVLDTLRAGLTASLTDRVRTLTALIPALREDGYNDEAKNCERIKSLCEQLIAAIRVRDDVMCDVLVEAIRRDDVTMNRDLSAIVASKSDAPLRTLITEGAHTLRPLTES